VRRFPAAPGILALLLVILAARPAGADTVASKQAEAQRIAQQLQSDGVRLGQLAEQYDQARIKADAVDQQAATAQTQLAQSDAALHAAMARVKAQAVDAYMGGNGLDTLSLAPSSPSTDPSRRDEYVDAVIGAQQDAIDGLRQARVQFDANQADLTRAKQAADLALAQVRANQAAAAAVQQTEQATLRNVQGELAGLVAAAAQHQAAADATKAQLALASHTSTAGAPTVVGHTGATGSHTTTTRGSGGGAPAPTGPPPPPASGAGAAVQFAKEQLGKPYQYGGSGPDSYDCSGLTMMSWRAGGVSLPHSAADQYSITTHVPIADLEPGDLVFYGSPAYHVGIYVGGGQMIEAPETGEVVRYASIYRSDLQPDGGRP